MAGKTSKVTCSGMNKSNFWIGIVPDNYSYSAPNRAKPSILPSRPTLALGGLEIGYPTCHPKEENSKLWPLYQGARPRSQTECPSELRNTSLQKKLGNLGDRQKPTGLPHSFLHSRQEAGRPPVPARNTQPTRINLKPRTIHPIVCVPRSKTPSPGLSSLAVATMESSDM